MKNTTFILTVMLAFVTSCGQASDKKTSQSAEELKADPKLEIAYFASGCFWCVEAVYESVAGVSESISGYAGGHTENPTYEASNTGLTGHAEAVAVYYDPNVVSFSTLVDVYFGSQNITQVNGQGPDRGSQYRSIIFYQSPEQKNIIDAKIAALNKQLAPDVVAAEVMPFEKFWEGEAYHQNYEKLHPNQGYIRKTFHICSKKKFLIIKRLFAFNLTLIYILYMRVFYCFSNLF
jgi:peptide-methionine (S)-S-oxide reductase